ncbi:unnamed protein product [Miscanthus lutarioriparius]|uniref:Signal recognition particle 54 kDa protein n=1 Tax=Miscanthus lutarioriparius TaxID=422564 RepID=A0A811Q293_9POAL|nr:unnamed protein product [Miscanthus lutarioriparius]
MAAPGASGRGGCGRLSPPSPPSYHFLSRLLPSLPESLASSLTRLLPSSPWTASSTSASTAAERATTTGRESGREAPRPRQDGARTAGRDLATVIDEKVLNDCLNEISRALLQADVQFKMVRDMQANIKRIVNLEALAADTNKRRIMQQAVFTELCNMLDPEKPSFTPKKGKPSVVMFVGLQGSGKTTTCTKYAYYHQRKGFKPALSLCSYMESDPVKFAVEGVERFKKENCDLIIVDTSGRHKQEAALFEEMRQVSEATLSFLRIIGLLLSSLSLNEGKESIIKMNMIVTTNEDPDKVRI